MQIEERERGSVVILEIEGKMLIGEGDELLREKINGLAKEGKVKILINLEKCPYMDAAGLGEISRSFTATKKRGGKLRFSNPTKRVKDLLLITKLFDDLKVFDDEETAVKSFA